jgi:hypothetical protein
VPALQTWPQTERPGRDCVSRSNSNFLAWCPVLTSHSALAHNELDCWNGATCQKKILH